MYGQYDYNCKPLVPLSCAVQMRNKPSLRKSWDSSTIDGYYLGTLRDHYHCFNILTKDIRSERTSDGVFQAMVPKIANHHTTSSFTNMLVDNATESIGPTTMQQLRQLVEVFSSRHQQKDRITSRKELTYAPLKEAATDFRMANWSCQHILQEARPNLIVAWSMGPLKQTSHVII